MADPGKMIYALVIVFVGGGGQVESIDPNGKNYQLNFHLWLSGGANSSYRCNILHTRLAS